MVIDEQLIEHAAQTAAPLFQMYGWTYGEDRAPTLAELRNTISELFEVFKEKNTFEVSSGRFTVKRYIDELDEVHYQIYLDLAES